MSCEKTQTELFKPYRHQQVQPGLRLPPTKGTGPQPPSIPPQTVTDYLHIRNHHHKTRYRRSPQLPMDMIMKLDTGRGRHFKLRTQHLNQCAQRTRTGPHHLRSSYGVYRPSRRRERKGNTAKQNGIRDANRRKKREEAGLVYICLKDENKNYCSAERCEVKTNRPGSSCSACAAANVGGVVKYHPLHPCFTKVYGYVHLPDSCHMIVP